MNDKAFGIFAISLVAAVGSLFSLAVWTGIASVPPTAFIVEHVALAVALRSSYKTLDGSNPVVDFLEFYGWKSADGAAMPSDAMASAA